MEVKRNIENGTVTLPLGDYIVLKKDSEDLRKLCADLSTETVPVIYHEWQYMGVKNGEIVILTKDEAMLKLMDKIKGFQDENLKLIEENFNLKYYPKPKPKKWYQLW